jgi:hypothetical protein
MKPLLAKGSRFRRPLFIIYFVANVLGLMLYLWYITDITNLAEAEQRDYYDGIDDITYICTAGLVLLLCVSINILWVIKVLIKIFWRKSYHAFALGMVVAAFWTANLGFCGYLARSAIRNGVIHFDP